MCISFAYAPLLVILLLVEAFLIRKVRNKYILALVCVLTVLVLVFGGEVVRLIYLISLTIVVEITYLLYVKNSKSKHSKILAAISAIATFILIAYIISGYGPSCIQDINGNWMCNEGC